MDLRLRRGHRLAVPGPGEEFPGAPAFGLADVGQAAMDLGSGLTRVRHLGEMAAGDMPIFDAATGLPIEQ